MLDKTKPWSEMAASLASAGAAVATLIEPRWFELLFDVAPDEGDGSLETWVTVLICVAASAAFGWRAAVGLRRPPRRDPAPQAGIDH